MKWNKLVNSLTNAIEGWLDVTHALILHQTNILSGSVCAIKVNLVSVLVAAEFVAETADDINGILERFPEFTIEISVDDRIQRGIEVPNPEQSLNDYLGAFAAVAQALGDVPDKEWQPADDEHPHDDSQSLSGLVFFFNLTRCLLDGVPMSSSM
ncbi:hypothetical protein CEXT_85981 [Caerostris extrusa]|uniref:Uncharacterized protein n=1 Tax=Caerostris extrusa TaxID=172846 RepID=A0AAV4Y2U0_CAEEX|nr:hypothetical protein CEXT_85981 [Caerostris extrusa]